MVSAFKRIAEVIEASTSEVVCQCDRLHEPPPLGSVVVLREDWGVTYGITANAETTGIDPTRRPVARGAGFDDEADLYRNHPELSALLRTVFRAVIVGHRPEGSRVTARLPDLPPRVHAFVFPAEPDDLGELAQVPDLIPDMVTSRPDVDDDAVAATIRALADLSPDPASYLVRSGRRLVGLMRGEPLRLQALLQKIRPAAAR